MTLIFAFLVHKLSTTKYTNFICYFLVIYYFFKNKIKNLSVKEQKNAFYEIKTFQQTFKGIKEILTNRKISKFINSYNDVTKNKSI